MYDAPGIGLAAIQVGVAKRILVIDLQEPDPEDEEGKALIRDPRVFINPVFSDESEEHSVYQEGCLSVPEQYAEVTRPAEVTVDWQDADGKHNQERSEEHTSELQSLMRISYAVFCLQKKKKTKQ